MVDPKGMWDKKNQCVYRGMEALKSVLRRRGLGINAKKYPGSCNWTDVWGMIRKVNVLKKFGECHEWIELGIKRCIERLE